MERDLLSGGAREASLREESEKTRLFFQDRCEHRKRRYREKFLISSEGGGKWISRIHRSSKDQSICISIDRDD